MIRSIDPSHGNLLVQNLKDQKLSNKMANKILMVFKQVLKFAEIEGYLRLSPLRNFPMLPESKGRTDFLTRDEVLREHIYPILVMAVNTGMRIGELTGLCWDRINFETSMIEVSRSMTRNGLKDSTKTNLVRYVPINLEVREVLKELMRRQQCPRFVSVDRKGLPYNPDHFSKRHLSHALKRANVRSVSFHILRHTFASNFMMNGGNIFELQKILGHTKVEMTTIYAHLSHQHLKDASNVVRFSASGDNSNRPFLALSQPKPEDCTGY